MKTQSDVTPRSTQHETPSIGTMKRFLELWSAGPALKKSIEDDPYAVVQQYHLELDPESVRPLWDRECALRYQQQNIPVSPAVQRYREFIRKKLQWRDTIREECAPAHPDFRTWRQRQIARTKIQIGVESDNQMVHAPVAFELAKGCSVGCWFCGFDALPLSSIFEYNQENAALWQDVLQTVKEIIGPATKWAACYYATEPLDNPGYEQFCLDLCRILGMFPQTTTALPLKDVKRTRALLELSKQQGSKTVNRFSVLSLKILEKLYQEFHPDELEDVELIIQAQESDSVKAVSGKFLKKTSKHTRLKTREYQKYVRQVQEKTETIGSSESEIIAAMPATISCISG
jgi:radical SAM family RiPP maturation amino acid epimerase